MKDAAVRARIPGIHRVDGRRIGRFFAMATALRARTPAWLDEEGLRIARRTLFRVVVIICLYPILLGGVAGLRQQYRVRWLAMRAEHRAALARDRSRMAERERKAAAATEQMRGERDHHAPGQP